MCQMKVSESVGKGHPDKLCDIISDSILDEALRLDKNARVALETWTKGNDVGLIGEVTCNSKIDYEGIVRKTLKDIGYFDEEWGINPNTCIIHQNISEQSSEIAQGVDTDGAGDQGIMWGFACDDTPEFLPKAQVLSNKLLKYLDELMREVDFIRPDMKSQVILDDNDDIEKIILAIQHSPKVSEYDLKNFVLTDLLQKKLHIDLSPDRLILNGTGKFCIGGPKADAGLTGRKIIVDTYGGEGRHGGGAFSGKDPSKVDRSGAYMARLIAKSLVASNYGKEAHVQLSYCIGVCKPQSLRIILDGKLASIDIHKKIRNSFDLTPAGIINYLNLKEPSGWSYKSTDRKSVV